MTNQMDPNGRLLKILQAPPAVQTQIDRLLNGEAEPQKAQPSGPLLLGMSAAAKHLGVSRATLWRMCQAKRLEKVEVLPGSYRIRRADLEALVGERGAETCGN